MRVIRHRWEQSPFHFEDARFDSVVILDGALIAAVVESPSILFDEEAKDTTFSSNSVLGW